MQITKTKIEGFKYLFKHFHENLGFEDFMYDFLEGILGVVGRTQEILQFWVFWSKEVNLSIYIREKL